MLLHTSSFCNIILSHFMFHNITVKYIAFALYYIFPIKITKYSKDHMNCIFICSRSWKNGRRPITIFVTVQSLYLSPYNHYICHRTITIFVTVQSLHLSPYNHYICHRTITIFVTVQSLYLSPYCRTNYNINQ